MKDYQYDYEWDSKYCYPNSFVLINSLNIKDKARLNESEREITSIRISQIKEHPCKGNLDLKHLQKIHKFIFQDVYSWAGQLRTVNIAKGNQFCNCMYIEPGFDSIYEKLINDQFLLKVSPDMICDKLAFYLGEINVVHPFREGNGRAQRVFIQYLAQIAGYSVNFANVTAKEMIEASAAAFDCDYHKMTELFRKITEPIPAQDQEQFIHSIVGKNSSVLAAYKSLVEDQEQTPIDDESPAMKF